MQLWELVLWILVICGILTGNSLTCVKTQVEVLFMPRFRSVAGRDRYPVGFT